MALARSYGWLVVAAFLVCLAIVVIAIMVLGRTALIKTHRRPVNPSGTITVPAPAVAPAPPTVLSQSGTPQIAFHPHSARDQLQELHHEHFLIGYDNQRRNPAWVLYQLDGALVNEGHQARRPQQFAVDPATLAQVRDQDYSRSGYDRGHMCPSYAMFSRFGVAGEDETFIMSNVIPQVHTLNAGLWEDLEEHQAGRAGKIAGWASATRHLTIINGPVYSGQVHYLASHVEVPDACYSIVFAYRVDHGDYQAMAFEMPNRDGVKGPLERYLVSIRDIENQTGLDFFAGAAEGLRQKLEAVAAPSVWP